MPGTPIGNGLIDMIADLQDVANATLRSLVNNMSISSGPQVVVNDDRVLPEENTDDLYPWKRWHARNDPVGNNTKPPVEFFQPQSNAQDLIDGVQGVRRSVRRRLRDPEVYRRTGLLAAPDAPRPASPC